MDTLDRLQQTLHNEIPLTRAMGLTVSSYAEGCLVLRAPLSPNINHKQTAFAGSLNAALTLTCWSLIWLVLAEEQLHGKIVIQDSTIAYHRPITTDFAACCCRPEPHDLARFLEMLRRKARARLALSATIWEHDIVAVTFTGRYVVLLEPAQRLTEMQ